MPHHLMNLRHVPDDEADEILMNCRFAELYQGKMRDLFGNLVEWFGLRIHSLFITPKNMVILH